MTPSGDSGASHCLKSRRRPSRPFGTHVVTVPIPKIQLVDTWSVSFRSNALAKHWLTHSITLADLTLVSLCDSVWSMT